MTVIGGKYYVKLTAKKPVYWNTFPAMDDLSDVYASVKVDQILGSKTADYGIIVRGSDSTHYFYSIGAILQGYMFQTITADGGSILDLMDSFFPDSRRRTECHRHKGRGAKLHHVHQRRAGG